MRRVTITLTTVVTVIVAAVGLTACSADQRDSGDGKLTVYSARPQKLLAYLIKQFENQTGTQVKLRIGSSAALADRLVAEGSRTKADVFLAQDAGALSHVANNQLFAPLPQIILDKVPAQYRSSAGDWIGTTGRARAIVYNPALVSKEQLPRSVFELVSPTWRNRVGIAPGTTTFQDFVTAMRMVSGADRAQRFLADLRSHQAAVYDNNDDVVAEVEAGRLAVGLIDHDDWYGLRDAVGPAGMKSRLWFIGHRDPGALVNASGVGMLAHARRDNDARRFIGFLLAKETQVFFVDRTNEFPLAGKVSPTDGMPALSALAPPAVSLDELSSRETSVQLLQSTGLISNPR